MSGAVESLFRAALTYRLLGHLSFSERLLRQALAMASPMHFYRVEIVHELLTSLRNAGRQDECAELLDDERRCYDRHLRDMRAAGIDDFVTDLAW
jgi:hypothetical protein